MRTRTFALLSLAAGLGLVGAADPPEFKPYASAAGRFKVLFPGAVKTEAVELKTELGPLTLTLDSVELAGGTSFVVTYLDYPDKTPVEPAKRLDKVRDGNKGATGKLVSEKDVAVGLEKHPAQDVLIEKPRGFVRNRIVVVGSRLYQVMVQGPKEFVTSPEADRFISSFEVTR